MPIVVVNPVYLLNLKRTYQNNWDRYLFSDVIFSGNGGVCCSGVCSFSEMCYLSVGHCVGQFKMFIACVKR